MHSDTSLALIIFYYKIIQIKYIYFPFWKGRETVYVRMGYIGHMKNNHWLFRTCTSNVS